MLILEDRTECPGMNSSPLNFPTYLKSSIDTIVDSLGHNSDVSLHDLSDAYDTFSFRLKSQSQTLQDSTEPLAALKYLVLHSHSITQALDRDIRRVHIDPFSPTPRHATSLGEFTSSVGSEITEDVMQLARDTSSVCHYALCTLSSIFRLSALYTIFSSADISLLLDDILSIVLAKSLPVHNSQKAYSISIWIFQVQQLPLAYLSPRKREIISVVKRALKEEEDHHEDSVIDGLKAIFNFITHSGSVFLVPISDLLPCILSNIVSSSFNKRHQAACVIGRMAYFLVTASSPSSRHCRDLISRHVLTFIDAHCSKSRSSDLVLPLSDILQEAIKADQPSSLGQGPSWALSVLASLIVLSDYSLFASPHALKLFLNSLALVVTHKRSAVRALHPHVWRCLVWAFNQLPSTWSNHIYGTSIKQSAFLVVKQELGTGLGIALTASLVGAIEGVTPSSEWRSIVKDDLINKAIIVVDEMIHNDNDRTSQDGLSLLHKLLSAIGAPSVPIRPPWNPNKVLALPLLDGTIINAEWDRLTSVIRAISQVAIEDIRQLSEAEITEHWQKLASMWAYCVRRTPGVRISTDLVHIWQSLLLGNAQLTQGHGHLTVPSDSAKWVVALVTDIIDQPSVEGGDVHSVTMNITDQLRQLSIIAQLWAVMKNVFESPCLSVSAEYILGAILKKDFCLDDQAIRGVWSKLCADLVSVENPSFIGTICAQPDALGQSTVQRELWRVLARTILSSETRPAWQDIVSFLVVPFGNWILSDVEIKLWGDSLKSAILSARYLFVNSSFVVETFMERLSGTSMNDTYNLRREFCVLLDHIDVSEESPIPTLLLTEIDNTLCASYPPHSESLSVCIELLNRLRTFIISFPIPRIVSIISFLNRALCRWIGDNSEALSHHDYNNVVMPLYCDTLKALKRHLPTQEDLVILAPFLASGFQRIPPPALGPMAFAEFWKATCYGQAHLYKIYPDRIKLCLKAFDDAFGGDLSVGLSLSSESQSSTSSVPDSQPSSPQAIIAAQQLYSWSSYDPSRLAHGSIKFEDVQTSGGMPLQRAVPSVVLVDVPILPASGFSTSASEIRINQQAQDYLRYSEDRSVNSSSRSTHGLQQVASDAPRTSPSRSRRSPLIEISVSKCNYPGGSIKRKLDDSDVKISKRNRTAGVHSLRRSQRLASEPTRRVTSPVVVNRTGSLPITLNKRVTFDGVEVPTFQLVLARERQKKRVSQNPRGTLTPTRPRGSLLVSPTPSVLSEDYDTWEAGQVEVDMSEIEVENSLVEVPESSSPISENGLFFDDHQSLTYTRDAHSQHHGPFHIAHSLPAPERSSLRRSRTMSVGIEALQEYHAALKDSASQLPVQELLQHTTLVHQIGAILTKHMSKKLGSTS